MASKLQNFSTILKKCQGLMKGNVLKKKPLWYDVYIKHPPYLEPYAFRKTEECNVKEIVYEEDIEKARVYLASKLNENEENYLKNDENSQFDSKITDTEIPNPKNLISIKNINQLDNEKNEKTCTV